MVAATDALNSPVEAGEPIRAKMRVHAYMHTSNTAPARARMRFAFFMMIKSFLYRIVYRKI